MQQITTDFSLANFSDIHQWLSFLGQDVQIENIEYQRNFEWFKIQKKEELQHVQFDQIQFDLNKEEKVLIQNLNNAYPRICIIGVNSILYREKIASSFEIVYGKVAETIDQLLQNLETSDSWRRKKRTLPADVLLIPNPIYTNEREKEIISIESLPGHTHLMDYKDMLWFGSCWQMYFSPVYYNYIPKPLFDDFKDCYENKVFENGLRRITLHEKLMDFDLPENRKRQWAFRRQLGIDSIAHELTKANNRIEPLHLPVLITKQNCKAGETKVTRFLDGNDQLISSDKAQKKEIKEYLNDGVTVVLEETTMI